MHVLDLFSGIGGFSLGLERAGMRMIAFCESDGFARRVLARHWPGVPCFDDIRRLRAADLRELPRAELVCGGFPCQDVSSAGPGNGLDGSRSGLWHEMLRVVHELRPGWVLVENVPALRVRGADRVLAGLEAAGYACWPLVVGAAHAGAPHRRGGCSWWPTPMARDWKGGSAAQRGRRRSCQLPDAAGGCLNPEWVEWLMGFPPGWTGVSG